MSTPKPAAAPTKAAAAGQGASIGEVAARAGVSIATVSRVLNGVSNKASAETATRVRRAAAELGYRPVSVGRALRQGRSRLVAVLAANLANPTMAAIAASAEAALRAAGLVMVLADTHDRPDLQDEYLLEMRAQLAHAIVLLGAIDSPGLRRFVAGRERLLFVNRRCPFEPDMPFVGIDNRAAGRAVAAHLRAAGIEDVAVIHASLASSATADRIDGFREAWGQTGATLAAEGVLGEAGADHLAIGQRAARRLLSRGRPPRGLFCSSDLIAYGAHRALTEAGLRVPDDVLIVGFDDNPLNDWVAPWLTSVSVPYDAFGAAIAAAVAAEGQPTGAPLLPFRLHPR